MMDKNVGGLEEGLSCCLVSKSLLGRSLAVVEEITIRILSWDFSHLL